MEAAAKRCGACGASLAPDAPACAYCGAGIVYGERDLSRLCAGCGARSPGPSRFCTACGGELPPESAAGAAGELPCPVCAVPMHGRAAGERVVSECPRCHGIWAAGDGLEQLVDAALEARRAAGPDTAPTPPPRRSGGNPAAERVRYRRCPACSQFMARRNFRRSSGVILDTCRDCGTWLDADELEAIAGFVLRGGEPSPLLVGESARAGGGPRASTRSAALPVDVGVDLGVDRGVPSWLDLLAGLLR